MLLTKSGIEVTGVSTSLILHSTWESPQNSSVPHQQLPQVSICGLATLSGPDPVPGSAAPTQPLEQRRSAMASPNISRPRRSLNTRSPSAAVGCRHCNDSSRVSAPRQQSRSGQPRPRMPCTVRGGAREVDPGRFRREGRSDTWLDRHSLRGLAEGSGQTRRRAGLRSRPSSSSRCSVPRASQAGIIQP